MNPNPVFKVTPLFDAKYLTNGYTSIVTIEGDRKPYPSFQMVPISMTLSDL